jgi:hypothetical protein
MKYEIAQNSNWTLSDQDVHFLQESDNQNRNYDEYVQKMNELQNIFDLSDIERNFQENQYKQFHIFREKNKMYGKDNISGGNDLDDETYNISTLESLYTRMQDKMNRFKMMLLTRNFGTVDESLIDTLDDLANYANIASLVKQGKWK